MEDYNSSALVLNDSTSELVGIQSEQTADLDCHDGTGHGHENGSSDTPKKDIGEDKLNLGAGCGGVTANARSVSPTRESPSYSKLDADKQDSASARV